MTRQTTISTLSLSLCLFAPLGCDPEPESVGEGLPSETEAGYALQWRAAPRDQIILDIAALPGGGVAVLERNLLGVYRLRRLSEDGEETLDVVVEGSPDSVEAIGEGFMLLGSIGVRPHPWDPDPSIERAAIWRLSSEGEVEASYVHPRPGDSNAFGVDVAVGADEVAIAIGNWGTLAAGEPWHELLRLTPELVPLGGTAHFDGRLEGIGYTADGHLVALETWEGLPGTLHDLDAPESSITVDCAVLLPRVAAATQCVALGYDVRLTDASTGDVASLGPLGFEWSSGATGRSSVVLAGGIEGGVRVVEVDGDGSTLRTAELPFGDGTGPIVHGAFAQTEDRAVYVTALEHVPEEVCTDPTLTCIRSQVVRLVPR